MKTIISLLLFTIIYQCIIAQNGYSVLYERQTLQGIPSSSFKQRLVIKDSVSYEYFFQYRDDGKKPYGSMFRLHSTYKNISSHLMLSQSEPASKGRYLITDTIHKLNWNLLSDEKIVLNYRCKNAHVLTHGKNYVVWYTEQIPLPFGPGVFLGLPGLILQVYSEDGHITTATSIAKVNVEIQEPAKGKKITGLAFNKLLMKSYKQNPSALFR